jgi:hypothetical protein
MIPTLTYPLPFLSLMEETVEELLRMMAPGLVARLFGLHGSGKSLILAQTVRRLAWKHPEASFLIWFSEEQRWTWQALGLETRNDPRFFFGTTTEVIPEAVRRLHHLPHPPRVAPPLSLGQLFAAHITGIADWRLVARLSHWSREKSGEMSPAALRHNLETTFTQAHLQDLLLHYEAEAFQRLREGLSTDTATMARWLIQETPPGRPADYIVIDHEDVLTPLLIEVGRRWVDAGATVLTAEDPFRCFPYPDWRSPLPDGLDTRPDIPCRTINSLWFLRTPQTIARRLNELYFPETYPSHNPQPGAIEDYLSSHAFWARQRDYPQELPLTIATRWLSATPFLHSLDFLPVTAFLSPRHLELFHYVRRRLDGQYLPAAPSRWLAALFNLHETHFGYLKKARTPSARRYQTFIEDFFSLLHMLMRTGNVNSSDLFDRLGSFFTLHPMTRFIVHATDENTLPEVDRLILIANGFAPVIWSESLTMHEQYLHYLTVTRAREKLVLASTPILIPHYQPC